MYVIISLLVLLFLVSLACLIAGARLKRKNIGFLIMTGIIALCDLICIALVNVHNAREAGNVLMPYYILHAWMLFAVLVMIIMVDRYKKFIIPCVLSAIVCIYQTYLAISQYFGARIFSFQKRIYFGKAWWVAADSKNTGILFSYRSYRIAGYINLALILIVLAACIIYSHRIFRMKYISHILMISVYAVLESLTIVFQLPVWLPGILMNLASILCLFYTGYYANNRLREWSLDRFANDMSDGLILYDKYDDLIHMNDMIKTTLNEELIEAFKDKSRLKEWIESAEEGAEGGVITYEGAARRYYFKVTEQNLGGHGMHIGTLYILHDTTDSMNRIKAMQRANDELERASRMKSDFLANMSHEIRTPMNAVIGMAEIAMREKDPAQITDYLLQIQRSGRNLLNIINDILDYSKIESGKMEIIEDEYEPFVELEDVANVLATRIGDKPLELFVFVKDYLPRKLYGDQMRIRQILINLANNAIKFTNSGMVKIVLSCEKTGDDTADFTFHVIDTGIGIKEEDLKKLFVSFQQVDSRRNRSAEGTGLGLAISQRLAEAMGGSIGVTSTYGVGSDFWFTIPQKIMDAHNELEVSGYKDIYAYTLAQNADVLSMFNDEMANLKIEGKHLDSIDEYVPSGKDEFVFMEEDACDDKMKAFLDEHSDVNGIIFGAFGSDFETDRPNLHVLYRPATTMRMVRTLNKQFEIRNVDEGNAFRIDYTAPDAHILVVDDNDINLTIAEGLLEPLKVKIDTAGGGLEAIEKAGANDYDIILMDHMMPEVDGVDATRKIREIRGESDKTVIIALSANAMEESRTLFKEVGMNDFVAKPIDVKDLVTALKKWLPEEKIQPVEESTFAGTEDGINADILPVSIDGLDTGSAVRALGSAALYDKIAGEYYRSGEDKLNGIRKAYEDKDWPDYTIRVHALKSSSRQIGAIKLGDMAEELEKAGKAGDIDVIEKNTNSTLDEFGSLLDKLKSVYDTGEDTSDKPMIDDETFDSLLKKLEHACDELDMDEMEDVSSALKEYNYIQDVQELIAKLHKAINDIDTEECSSLIAAIRERSAV